jgi:flagellin
VKVAGADGGATQTVTLNKNYTAAADPTAALASDISGQLTGAKATAVYANGKEYLQIAATSGGTGPASSLQVLSGGTGNAALGLAAGTYSGSNESNLGFGSVSGQSFAGVLAVAPAVSTLSAVNASGASQSGALSFTGLAQGGGTQALTLSANDSTGTTQATTITLAATGSGTPALGNDGTASNIDSAVNYINQQLQKTDNPTLQSIVAVKQNVNGVEEINFLSPLNAFQVAVGTGGTTSAPGGLDNGVAETVASATNGSGSTLAIDTQEGAEAAVTAVGNAVQKLGTAQAVVGRGENQLGFAIDLAQSQITNFSAAESQIRDADVAQEAANLTKAQVLQQASLAAMAQANTAPQAVLALLRT